MGPEGLMAYPRPFIFYDDVHFFLTQRYPLTRLLGSIVLRLPHDILLQAHAGRVL